MRRSLATALSVSLLLALAACRGHAREDATVQVVVETPGHALDLERAVAVPIETALMPIDARTSIRSTSEDDRVVVTVRARGDDLALRQQVVALLAGARGLPAGVQPVVGPSTTPDGAIMRYTLTSPSAPLVQVRRWNDDLVRRELLRVPGVAAVSTCGASLPAIRVRLDPAQLAEMGIKVHDVEAAITSALGVVRGSTGTIEPTSVSATSLAPLIVATKNGATIQLRDVAMISDDAAPPTCFALDDHEQVVLGTVWLRAGDSRTDVRDAAVAALATTRKTLPPATRLDELTPTMRGELALVPDATLDHKLALVKDAAAHTPGAVFALGRDDDGWLTDGSDVARVFGGSDGGVAALAASHVPDAIWYGDGDPNTAWVIVSGPDLGALQTAIASLPKDVAVIRRLGDQMMPQVRFEPDREAIGRYGVDPVELAESLALVERPHTIATVRASDGDGNEDVLVELVRSPKSDGAIGSEVFDVERLYVAGTGGAQIPLSQLVRTTAIQAPQSVMHMDGKRVVAAQVRTDDLGALREKLATELKLPVGAELDVRPTFGPR